MGDSVERPDDDDIIREVAEVLNLSQADTDKLRLSVMESNEKAIALLEKVRNIGQNLSIEHDGKLWVNTAWLSTLMLMEADQVMRGHGGCADHMRVVDWLETTVLAAQLNVQQQLDSPE